MLVFGQSPPSTPQVPVRYKSDDIEIHVLIESIGADCKTARGFIALMG